MEREWPGVTEDSILLGSFQRMTGHESSYSRIGKGADTWYRHVNGQGGIHGRKIIFRVVDDSCNPARTKVLVKELIERDKVLAIANPLGSAPTAAVIDYIVEKRVPLIGAGTSAAKKVAYPNKHVFPLFPSYFIEAGNSRSLPKSALGQKLFPSSIRATLEAGLMRKGFESASGGLGMKLVAAEPYEQGKLDVSAQVIKIRNVNPDVPLFLRTGTRGNGFHGEAKAVSPPGSEADIFVRKQKRSAFLNRAAYFPQYGGE